MLVKIYCDKFSQKEIIFHKGLNCILGDDKASNSIGKSTLLLIIDYAFGGHTYANNQEINKNIGNHRIYFTFQFDEKYEFYRDFDDKKNVYKAGSNDVYSLDEYYKWLLNKYNVSLLNTSFRDIVSRYSRIYTKSVISEKQPLAGDPHDSPEKGIVSLIKLFNYYGEIQKLESEQKESYKKYKAYKSAREYNFISSINAKTASGNLVKINELNKLVTNLKNDISTNSNDLDALKLQESLIINSEVRKIRRKRTIELNQRELLNDNLSEISPISKCDLAELALFFPNINIEKIESIQNFHSLIQKNLKLEIKKNIEEKNIIINMLEEAIKEQTSNLSEISNNPQSLKSSIVQRLIETQREIDELQKQNDELKKLKELENEKKQKNHDYENKLLETLQIVEQAINTQMNKINNLICSEEIVPPLIKFLKKNSYSFETLDDNGTGTNYKNLIVFDVSILELTQLPFFIHDSIMFKNIGDESLENILTLYNNISEKQVFIALDKINQYTEKSTEILKNNKVIGLDKQGNQLFGRSWNIK